MDQTERTQARGLTFFSSPLGVQISKSSDQSTFYARDNVGNIVGERLLCLGARKAGKHESLSGRVVV